MDIVKTFNWDDEITKDDQFVIPPEGDYIFQVIDFERGFFNGSNKIPACNKAVLTLQIMYSGAPTMKEHLLLCSSFEWKLSAFFHSIGLKKTGETLKMNWDEVVGKSGKAHFQPYSYTGKNGIERQSIQLTRYYDFSLDNFENIDFNDTPFSGGF